MTRLSLRLRVFLFFLLLAVTAVAIVGGALFAGYARAADADFAQPFLFSGVVAGFLLLALVTAVWWLFDQNMAQPIEKIAADLRLRAHSGIDRDIQTDAARYLGDLAPAANAVSGRLSGDTMATAAAVAEETAKLAAEKARLTALLTQIPVAMVLAGPDHRIVLYDGQAAEVLSAIAPARLQASLFDYLDRADLEAAHADLAQTGETVTAVLQSADGKQDLSVRLHPLGDAPGYMVIFDDMHARMAPEAQRPLVYDFSFLDSAAAGLQADTPLTELRVVVFDTETTGLLAHKDALVQIGAVRVVNGRIVPGETFDTLINPGRSIPAASTKVHGISDQMVSDAPDIVAGTRAFHSFATDAVLMAHNAPFDMAFLQRSAGSAGLDWSHPVLDTVLLSAVIWGTTEIHSLDAICDRLDIVIPDALRHTALGDAHATAEVYCTMLPLLAARGFDTWGAIRAEVRRHSRLLEDLT